MGITINPRQASKGLTTEHSSLHRSTFFVFPQKHLRFSWFSTSFEDSTDTSNAVCFLPLHQPTEQLLYVGMDKN